MADKGDPIKPKSDEPSQNSQLYNATRKQGEAKPSDYPNEDRQDASLIRKPDQT